MVSRGNRISSSFREEYRQIKRPFSPMARVHPVAHPASTDRELPQRASAQRPARLGLLRGQRGWRDVMSAGSRILSRRVAVADSLLAQVFIGLPRAARSHLRRAGGNVDGYRPGVETRGGRPQPRSGAVGALLPRQRPWRDGRGEAKPTELSLPPHRERGEVHQHEECPGQRLDALGGASRTQDRQSSPPIGGVRGDRRRRRRRGGDMVLSSGSVLWERSETVRSPPRTARGTDAPVLMGRG